MEKEKKEKKIKFIFQKPEELQLKPVNGVFGGLTPRGDFICHFFLEYRDVPKDETATLKEDGSIQSPKHEKLEFVRDIQSSIVLNPAHALEIAEWILNKIKETGLVVKKEKGEKIE